MNVFYNFKSTNLNKWRNALNSVKSGTANAHVACIGDSTTCGYGSAGNGMIGARLNSYPAVLAQMLSQFYVAAQSDSFFGDAHSTTWVTYPTYDPRVSMPSGWGFYSSNSLGGYMFTNSTNANPLGFTPSVPVDTFEIYYLQNSDFHVNVDGGSALATYTSIVGATMVKSTVTCALGIHTFNIIRDGSTYPVYIVGVNAYNSANKSIACMGMGMCSALSADWASSANTWSPAPSLTTLAPDLSIIDLGINDWNTTNHVAPFTFASNIQTVINAVKATGDIILMAPNPSDASVASVATQNSLIDMLYDLADKNDCPLIDLTQLRTSYAVSAPQGYCYDTNHPSQLGYFDIAKVVASAIWNP